MSSILNMACFDRNFDLGNLLDVYNDVMKIYVVMPRVYVLVSFLSMSYMGISDRSKFCIQYSVLSVISSQF